MPWECSVCGRPDQAQIDQALVAGTTIRAVVRAFPGVGRTAVANHKFRCLKLGEREDRARAARGRPRRKRPSIDVDVAPVETAADVMREVQRMYREAWALYEEAKRVSDSRLMDKALGQIGSTIDRFAKALRVYDDASHVTIDARTIKIQQTLSALSVEELRALAAGEQVA